MNAAKSFDGFDDLGSDFDSVAIATGAPETIEAASKNKSTKAENWVIEKCPKCSGSGWYAAPSSLGHNRCTKCSGTGKVKYKNDAKTRAANSQKARDRKAKKLADAFAAFETAHPDIAEWWSAENGDTGFAASLKESVRKYGSLTERQLAAAKKCIAKLAEMRVAKTEREAVAKETCQVNVKAIETAIFKAKAKSIKTPKVRMSFGEEDDQSMVVYPAAEYGRNAGSLYVKGTGDRYLGKVTEGVFYRSREVSPEEEILIVKAMQNPLESAVAYGRATGTCSCCGRRLDNALSIELGIGPICREKFFL